MSQHSYQQNYDSRQVEENLKKIARGRRFTSRFDRFKKKSQQGSYKKSRKD
jgi:hypothetical protein